MSAIETCRTAALGGHVERCEDCAHERDRLQLLPQPPLPEVSGRGGAAMAGRPRGRAAAGSLLSRRLHPAGGDRRHRVPEQGRRLRPPVQDRRRDADHHRRRPEASGRAHRPHRRAAHLGLGAHPSSARPRHRSRRRPVAGRLALDRLQARLLPARARAVAPVPPALPRRPRGRCTRPAASAFFGDLAPLADKTTPSTPRSRRCAAPSGSSTPSGRSPDRRPSSPISPATPTASRSRTRRLIALDDAGVAFKWKDYRIEGRDRLKTMTLDAARVHPPLSPARAAQRLPPHPPYVDGLLASGFRRSDRFGRLRSYVRPVGAV